jgi:hypothetical protein
MPLEKYYNLFKAFSTIAICILLKYYSIEYYINLELGIQLLYKLIYTFLEKELEVL